MKKAKISLPIIISTIILVVMVAIPFIAFNDSEAVTFRGPAGSYAETYAKQHGLPFEPAGEDKGGEPASAEIDYGALFTYENRDGSVVITGSKKGGDITIPETIGGAAVTGVDIDAVASSVTSVRFPAGVESIKGTYKTARYTASFFAAIIIILLAYVFAVVSALIAMKKAKTDEDTFYGIPLVYGGVIAFIIVAIWSNIALFTHLSVTIQVIVSIVVFAAAVAVLVMRMAARASIQATGAKVKAQTGYIKMLTADAQSLITEAVSDGAKASANSVYEAVRFSDPMSNGALKNVEERISVKFEEYSNAIRRDDASSIAALENELKILFAERNNKCRAMK